MKYSGAHVPFILIDGYDVKGDTTDVSDLSVESVLEETHTLGDSWFESTAVGIRKASFAQSGFFDDATGHLNDLFAEDTGTERKVVVGLSSTRAVAMTGAFGAKYSRILDRGKLHKAKVTYTVTGAVDEIKLLAAPADAQTADWNGTAQDDGAGSSNGGTGYMQVTALSGFTGFVGTIEDSPDNSTWTTLVTFTNVTSAPNAQVVSVTGSVDRYVRFVGNVTGTGSIIVQAGFARG